MCIWKSDAINVVVRLCVYGNRISIYPVSNS